MRSASTGAMAASRTVVATRYRLMLTVMYRVRPGSGRSRSAGASEVSATYRRDSSGEKASPLGASTSITAGTTAPVTGSHRDTWRSPYSSTPGWPSGGRLMP